MNSLLLCTSEDGQSRLQLRVDGGTIWLSQAEIAELVQTTKQNVSPHPKNILEEGELRAEATAKESVIVQNARISGNAVVKEFLTTDASRANRNCPVRFGVISQRRVLE